MRIWGERSDRLGKECGFILEKNYWTDSFKNCHQGLGGYPTESKSLRVASGLFSLRLTSANVTLVCIHKYIERRRLGKCVRNSENETCTLYSKKGMRSFQWHSFVNIFPRQSSGHHKVVPSLRSAIFWWIVISCTANSSFKPSAYC